MKIQEAIVSGRTYWRPGNPGRSFGPGTGYFELSESEILADDWIIDGEKKSFTFKEILEAVDLASSIAKKFDGARFTEILFEKLGFKS